MKPGQIQAVTFDVGGTLLEPWPSVGHVYANIAARYGINIDPAILNQNFAAAWKTKKDFGHRMSDWSDLVDQTFAGLVNLPPSKTFFRQLYDEFALPHAWRIFDDVIPCLEALQEREILMAAVSNWDERLRPLLKVLELDRFFKTIVVSIEVGSPKPDKKVFETAARTLQLAPPQILHIGDSRVEDVEGARAAGFQSLLIKRGEPSVTGVQINSLTQTVDLI